MGFTFNGITSKSMGIPSKMTVENRIPGLRNSTMQITGKSGVIDFGAALEQRTIELSCLVPVQKTTAGLLALKDALVEWLDPGKGVCDLTLDTEPDRYYKARLSDGVSFEKLVRRAATFDLSFLCPDPYAYATEDEVFTLTEDATITRTLGNVDSKPLYEVRAVLTEDQSLTFSVDGSDVTISGSLTATETFYLDTDSMTAWIETSAGVTRNALGNISELNFPALAVGDNTITISCDGTFTSLTINARSRWL